MVIIMDTKVEQKTKTIFSTVYSPPPEPETENQRDTEDRMKRSGSLYPHIKATPWKTVSGATVMLMRYFVYQSVRFLCDTNKLFMKQERSTIIDE